MQKVTELLVMETNMNIPRTDSFQWRILDVLNENGHGILPKETVRTYLEEQ